MRKQFLPLAGGLPLVMRMILLVAAAPVSTADQISLHTDGTLTIRLPAAREAGAPWSSTPELRFAFGLPSLPPLRRSAEDGRLPVFTTVWEKEGVRYTQTILLTRLGGSDLDFSQGLGPQAVLLVQLAGENISSDYTNATASFSALMSNRPVELELREGRVYGPRHGTNLVLAAVEVGGEALGATAGPELRFRGNMPPGTKGAMTIKILLDWTTDPDIVRRVADLEFDEEYRRLKRLWKEQYPAPAPVPSPLRLADTGNASLPDGHPRRGE